VPGKGRGLHLDFELPLQRQLVHDMGHMRSGCVCGTPNRGSGPKHGPVDSLASLIESALSARGTVLIDSVQGPLESSSFAIHMVLNSILKPAGNVAGQITLRAFVE
jgi:hypothetical protein